MILYRPVGIQELALIHDTGLRAFPPRLPDQPIFYPVLNRDYAVQIARDWNAKGPNGAGYVTRFSVDDAVAGRYERQVVGRREHEELWVPAEDLPAFNEAILGPIETIDGYFVDDFYGLPSERGRMREMDAVAQLLFLERAEREDPAVFIEEIDANARVIYLHSLFWQSRDFTAAGISPDRRDRTIEALRAHRPVPHVLPRFEP